jgi:hypothetical protein
VAKQVADKAMIEIMRSDRSLTKVVAQFTVLLLCGFQSMWHAGFGATAKQATELKLVAEYKSNLLQDISADGKLLLFYQSAAPARTFTIPIGNGRFSGNQQPTHDDVLRVVERESGREMGRVRVGFFPQNVQLVPGTQQVFYVEPSNTRQKYVFTIWDFFTGYVRACSDENALNFRYAKFLNGRYALGAVLQINGGELLGKLSLPECHVTTDESVDPSNLKSMMTAGGNLSHDKRSLAYVTSDELIIRDVTGLKIIKLMRPPPGLIFGASPLYTSDGKYLLIVATNTIFDKPETKRFLLLYDTTNFEIARRLDITRSSPPIFRDDSAVSSPLFLTAITVSPDSRLLAFGYTKESPNTRSKTVQAQVVLYDLIIGKEVGRAVHPSTKLKRNDPFAAKIGQLAFTPDGKYLLSSTYDTRVWLIGNHGGE